jgi:hypothetical protein
MTPRETEDLHLVRLIQKTPNDVSKFEPTHHHVHVEDIQRFFNLLMDLIHEVGRRSVYLGQK